MFASPSLAIRTCVLLALIAWALPCPPAAAAEDPGIPKVVSTIPENLAADVDAGLKEITVVYDRDMDKGGYSFVSLGDNHNYPNTRGKAKWKDARTCVVKVKLEPDTFYELGLNWRRYLNFKSVEGVPAENYRLQFATARTKNPRTAEDNQAYVDTLRKTIDEYYSYRDIRGGDWDARFERHGEALRGATSRASLALATAQLFAEVGDPHIWVEWPDGTIYPTSVEWVHDADLGVLQELVPRWRISGTQVVAGQFDDDIGYVAIKSWNMGDAAAVRRSLAVLEQLEDAPALIVDARFNGGGSEPLAHEFAGCFIEEPVVYAQHVVADPAAEGGFTPPEERILPPNPDGPRFRGPVAVLTGRNAMSSNEAFVMMMSQAPDSVVVGDRTHGASGNPQRYDIGGGITVYLPIWQSMTAAGERFEGTGLAPDVLVVATPEDLEAGRDPVLDEALRLLRAKLASGDEAAPEE